MGANSKQVGGTHYAVGDIPQHWDIVIAMGWDYLIGNATKYIWRLGKKNTSIAGQIEDIDKAIHYLEKKREVLHREFNRPHMHTQTMEIIQKPSMIEVSDPIYGPE